MLGMATNYNSDEHSIIGGDITDFLCRLVENDSQKEGKLFVVRYNKNGVFVIAEWLGRPKDVFVDVMNLGKSLSNFTRQKASELRQRLFAPLTAEETSKQIAMAESNYFHRRQDENEEEEERLQKCARGE